VADLPLDTYAGFVHRGTACAVDNATAHYTESELNPFRLADRSDFDHSAYQQVWLQATGSKGHVDHRHARLPVRLRLLFQPIFAAPCVGESLDAVFAEVEQISDLGYDSLWIADDDFTLSPPIWRASAGASPACDELELSLARQRVATPWCGR